jgi:hypothetical protein
VQRNRYLNDSFCSFACSRYLRFVLQEAIVDHDGPESSKDHDEEEREEEASGNEGESHEEAKDEPEPSPFAAVLEEIKAYGMLLARETQVHVIGTIGPQLFDLLTLACGPHRDTCTTLPLSSMSSSSRRCRSAKQQPRRSARTTWQVCDGLLAFLK